MGIHVDFEGNDLKIGDEIIYNPSANSSLMRGTVAGFTPKMVRCLKKGEPPTHTYTYSGKTYTTNNGVNRYSHDIYKI